MSVDPINERSTPAIPPPAAPPTREENVIQAQRALRDAFGSFVTGVTVVTARDAKGNLAGCTVNSFSSVSIDPPLVLWSLARNANSYPVFEDGERFTINVLSESQRHLSQLFASRGDDKFGKSSWTPGLGGVPVLDGALCFFECSKYASYPGGDHTIYIGLVENFQRQTHRPLVFGGGRYMTAFEDFQGSASKELREGNRARFEAERLAITLLPDIGRTLGRSVGIAMWGNSGPVVLYWEVNRDPITEGIQLGHVCSLSDTATGQAFVAFLPPEVTDDLRATQVAQGTLSDPDLEDALCRVRKDGFSCVSSPSTGLVSYSAPVYDESGLMMLALTTVLPLGEEPGPAISHDLKEQAALLSRKLGFRAGR